MYFAGKFLKIAKILNVTFLMEFKVNNEIVSSDFLQSVVNFVQTHLPELREDKRILNKFGICILDQFRKLSENMIWLCNEWDVFV